MSPDLRIAISGYYGFGNTGDEAVLAGIAESFKIKAGEGRVRLTVLSADPADTKSRHGLPAVNRMRMSSVRREIRESDLLLSGGGSLLQDSTSLRSILYYLWVVRLALAERRPVMFYAQGIGPLRRRASRFLTRIIADRVHQITVRDAESAQLLREIGVRNPPIEVTADPAFALSPVSPDRACQILEDAGLACGLPIVGIAPRPWATPHPTVEDYAEVGRRIHSECRAQICLLPMQAPGDLRLCEQIAARLFGIAAAIRDPLSPQEAAAVTGKFSALLAMRLHALIFAASVSTPIVALSYDPKVRSLMTALGQPSRCIELEHASADSVSTILQSTLAHAETARADLAYRARDLRSLALRNAEIALTLVRKVEFDGPPRA